jgi:hypothetical protein
MGKSDSLGLMPDGFTIDDCDLELFNNGLVDGVTLGEKLA